MPIENNRSYYLLLLSICLVLLSACSSTSTAVSVRDIDTIPETPMVNERADTPTHPTQAKSMPIYQERAPQALPIVERIFNQADAALQARQWQQAIALAEKGLRIERKEPRFYWVLASAYSQLSNKKQSQNFARQGLRYTSKGSRLARQLSAYLP